MKVEQIAEFTNSIAREMWGETAIQTENLENIVDMGKEFLSSESSRDRYVKALVDRINRVIFVNRVYNGTAPSVLMDSDEWGAVTAKIRGEMPEAQENASWKLTDGQSYDPNVFTEPNVSEKFYSDMVTLEVKLSTTYTQVKSAFLSPGEYAQFISMLETDAQNALTIRTEGLIMRVINRMIAETLKSPTSPRVVNLLDRYNTAYDKTLTPAAALLDMDFLRYAAFQISVYIDRMKSMSQLFNIGGKKRFTPNDRLHLVMLSDFVKAADVFLQSDTFHETYTALPSAETIPYWQGSGTTYDFADISKIQVQLDQSTTITQSGVLAAMWDRDALGVRHMERRTTTYWNAPAEFWNTWYKIDASYFGDTNENMIVFIAA